MNVHGAVLPVFLLFIWYFSFCSQTSARKSTVGFRTLYGRESATGKICWPQYIIWMKHIFCLSCITYPWLIQRRPFILKLKLICFQKTHWNSWKQRTRRPFSVRNWCSKHKYKNIGSHRCRENNWKKLADNVGRLLQNNNIHLHLDLDEGYHMKD